MSGRVLFTEDCEYELSRILSLSGSFHRKFYVYGEACADLSFFQDRLTDFVFLSIKDTFDPKYSGMIANNSESDFFVLKRPRINDVMDKNVSVYQDILRGYKFVVDNHPFLGKKDVYWCYFLWSFFDKSLLGYPHCYAFRGAKTANGVDPYDCSILAKKVSLATETTLREIFLDDIEVERVVLDDAVKNDYQELKKSLFDTETRPWVIVRKLKKFVNDQVPRLRTGLSLVDQGKVFGQYKNGERNLVVSDAKVDVFLESEFWKYVNNANSFMRALHDACPAK